MAYSFVIDTSALLWLYLADDPLPAALEPAMVLGYSCDALLLAPPSARKDDASVLLKQVQRAALALDESKDLLSDLLLLPVRTVAEVELVCDAFEQALQTSSTVYDDLVRQWSGALKRS